MQSCSWTALMKLLSVLLTLIQLHLPEERKAPLSWCWGGHGCKEVSEMMKQHLLTVMFYVNNGYMLLTFEVHLPCCQWWEPEAIPQSRMRMRRSSRWIQTGPSTACSRAAQAQWNSGPQREAFHEFYRRTLPLNRTLVKWPITATVYHFVIYIHKFWHPI